MLREDPNYANFDKIMKKFSNIWENLIDSLFVLCKSKAEYKNLQRLKFIVVRGIYEFLQFNKID